MNGAPAGRLALAAAAGAALTAAAFAALGAPRAPRPAPGGVDAAAVAGLPAGTQAEVEESRRTAIVAAAERVGRAVVAISARSMRQANPYAGTVWEDFFPLLRQPLPVQSLGSGFVVSPEGTIVTNAHVVEGADAVQVTFTDGRDFPAEIVGIDPTTDLAVLRIPAGNLPVAPLGTSGNLLIGEWAIAIGNPFAPLLADANPSVTVGVISALHRDVRPVPGQEQVWTDMIQTDASINPGNSGGPLVNAAGEVVGVNSFIFSRSGESIGIGFAIPIDRARRIADDLSRYGAVRPSWLGIHVRDAPDGGGAGVEAARVVVVGVDPGSPAERAGVREGDGVLSAGGRRVLSAVDWEGRRLDWRVDEVVELELERGGRPVEIAIQAAGDPLAAAPESPAPLGLRLTPLTPVLRSYLGARAESGLLVTGVAPGSPAQNIGLQPGDVLLAVDGERVATVEEAAARLRELPNRARASLLWERAGQLIRWQG
ncbi:MAG TPA: trypsin-like peptidase domain-containing protein [Gemmatimonadota bacterium]